MKYCKSLLIILIITLICTPYFEYYEIAVANTIRSFVYFKNKSHISDDSIPVLKLKTEKKGVYNPVTIALTVLNDAQNIIKSNLYKTDYTCKIDTLKIFKVADWFKNNSLPVSYNGIEGVVPYYNFDFTSSYKGLLAPWLSCMSQGHGAEVCLAAYYLSGDSSYYYLAEELLNVLKIPIEHGGVLENVDGGVWFEEYATNSPNYECPYVLNGHMFAMKSLYWFTRVDSLKWFPLYDSAFSAVESNIFKYKAKTWSKYDRLKTYANNKYHNIHIEQLSELLTIRYSQNIDQANKAFKINKLLPFGFYERLFFMHNRMSFFLLFLNYLVFSILFLFASKFKSIFLKKII